MRRLLASAVAVGAAFLVGVGVAAGAGRSAGPGLLATIRAPVPPAGGVTVVVFSLSVRVPTKTRPPASLAVRPLNRVGLPARSVALSSVRLASSRGGRARYVGVFALVRAKAPTTTRRLAGDAPVEDALEGIVAAGSLIALNHGPVPSDSDAYKLVDRLFKWRWGVAVEPKPTRLALDVADVFQRMAADAKAWSWSPEQAAKSSEAAAGDPLDRLAQSLSAPDSEVIDDIEIALNAQFAHDFPDPAGGLSGDSASLAAAMPHCDGFAAQGSATGWASVSFTCAEGAGGLGAGWPLTFSVTGGSPQAGGRLTYPGGVYDGNCTVTGPGTAGCGLTGFRAGAYSQRWWNAANASTCGESLQVRLTLQPPDGQPPLFFTAPPLTAGC